MGKAIDKSKVSDKSRFETEVKIQQSLTHPNIVKLYEVFRDAKRFYLVMELCTGGELFDRIVELVDQHEGSAFEEVKAAKIMEQILGAVHYMHEKRFVHRDIKPENFLLQDKSPDAPIKVIDFGLAKQFVPGESKLKTKAGTPYYVAPQVLSNSGGYNEKCDVWSCGVLCYIIICGFPPFYGDRDADILKMVKEGKFDFPSPDWDTVSKEGKNFISQMLTYDPDKRPSAGRLLQDTWLKRTPSGGGTVCKELGSRLRKFTGESKMKKVALTVIAQQMREEDIKEMKETFNSLDVNKDGTLAINEILEGMKKHRLAMPSDIVKTLENLDTDGSGTIDYDEFIAATLSTQAYLKREVLWSAFRVFDTDGSGEIDAHELKQVFKDASVAQIQNIITEVDTNRDGKVSFDEFCAMMGMVPEGDLALPSLKTS